jgi:potassium channel subfamily K
VGIARTFVSFDDVLRAVMAQNHANDFVEKRNKGQSRKKRWWNVFKRWKEGEESDWWFASTGIP